MEPFRWVAGLRLAPFDADQARRIAAEEAVRHNWSRRYLEVVEENIEARAHIEKHRRMVAAARNLRPSWFDPYSPSQLYSLYADSLTADARSWRTRLDAETAAVVSFIANPRGPASVCKGLVFGHVQSGKTSNFNGVACRAMDLGYRVVVILGGVKSALVGQTKGRIEADIMRPLSDRAGLAESVRAVEFPTRRYVRSCTDEVNRAYADGVSSVLMCTLKNSNRIPALRQFLSSLRPAGRGLPILVVDDECDEGLVPSDDPSLSAMAMMELFDDLSGLGVPATYIGYTATPVGNFLVREFHRHHTVFPRDFIYVMDDPPEEDEYIGIYNFLD